MQLAQVNVARMRADAGSPQMRAFTASLAPVYRLAEASPGFVWRLASGHEHRPVTRAEGGEVLVVNVSVWASYEALHDFTYRTAHRGLLRRRAEWFEPGAGPSTALWWVPDGERPDADQALRRLAYLRAHGPSPRAFTPLRRFGPDGVPITRRSPARR